MKNVYFIGIGGIGMSAIARYYKFKGFEVAGYDRTPSDLTFALEREGIDVHYMDRPDLLPEDKNETLVVYPPAVPADLKELIKAREEGYLLLKRSRTLGEISRGQRCLAVAGTHGKTTTSTLIAHILTQSREGCSAFLGGISRNYDTNLLMSENPTIVAEADEFDRSFLQLFPEIAVITAVDPDHLDIYGDYAHVVEAFKAFASQVSGTLALLRSLNRSLSPEKLLPLTQKYSELYDFEDVVPVSAKTGRNVDLLLSVITKMLPEGPRLYDSEYMTDQTERVIAAELIREQVLHYIAVSIMQICWKSSASRSCCWR